MGCGSSSLKGEKSDDATAQPIKKVRTDFSIPDYETGTQGRRDTTVGPLDPPRQRSELLSPRTEKQENPLDTGVGPDSAHVETKPSTTGDWRCGANDCDCHNPAEKVNCLRCGAPRAQTDQTNFEDKLPGQQPKVQDPITRNAEGVQHKEPYKDVTVSPTTPTNNNSFSYDNAITQPQITTASTDRQAFGDAELAVQSHGETNSIMGLFTKSKQPAVGAPELTKISSGKGASSSYASPLKEAQTDGDKSKKKSLYQKWGEIRRGPGTSGMSDEDYVKYTGKSRAEFDNWAATTPGVAGGQAAGSLTAGGTSGIGMSAGAGEGLGGWGFEAGKEPKVR